MRVSFLFRLIFDTHILNGKLSLFRVNCQIKSDLLQLSVPFRIIAVLFFLVILTVRYVGYLLIYPLAFFAAVGSFIVFCQWTYQEWLYYFKRGFAPI
ncbi:hypothetical protein F382_00840 [Mannheimia haemolytica D153]|nr:hypothetical protein F382_00840 [Mannheimia haemolytica D153]